MIKQNLKKKDNKNNNKCTDEEKKQLVSNKVKYKALLRALEKKILCQKKRMLRTGFEPALYITICIILFRSQ